MMFFRIEPNLLVPSVTTDKTGSSVSIFQKQEKGAPGRLP
jgi:hypothetical protein